MCESKGNGGEGRQRGRIEDGKKARALQKAIPSAFVGLPFFHSLSRSPLRGFSIPLPLSVCVPISFLTFSFFFLFYDVLLFFLLLRWFLQAPWLFFIMPSLRSQGFVALTSPVCISALYFHFALITPSVSFCLTLIHFHWLLLPTLRPISLIKFASPLLHSLLPSCISVPLIKSQHAVSSSSLLLSFVYILPSSPPFSRSKTLFAPDRYDAPGLLNRWRGYFCSSPWGHQTLCLSACLRWHPLQASSIWKCSSRVKAMFVHAAVFRSILLTTSVHAGQQKRCWIFLITHSALTCFNAAWLSLQSLSFAYFFLFLVSEQV